MHPSISFRLRIFGSSCKMRTDLMVNNFFRALNDGNIWTSFQKEFIHIRDVVRFLFSIENFNKMKGQIILDYQMQYYEN